jgi:hypothetical protein
MTLHRWLLLSPLLAALLLPLAACSSGSNTTTGITTPAPATSTDTFSGTLSTNGAATYPFAVQGAGAVSAALQTLTTADGSTPVPIGIALGTWNGTVCQLLLTNDSSLQGSTVPGQSTTAGNFCVRVYDASGTLTQPESYVVVVTHP